MGLALAFLAYGVLDVRQRARTDRGPRFHRTDFTVYQSAARALQEGENPYQATNPRGWRYVYPPLLALLLLPLADVAPPNAAFLFFCLSGLLLGCALATLAHLPLGDGKRVGGPAVLLATGLAVGFLHQSFQRGQITILLLAVEIFALSALARGKALRAGLLLGLGGALRLTPLLGALAVGVGFLVRLGREGGPRAFLAFAGGVGAALALSFVVLPLLVLGKARAIDVHQQWLESTARVYGRTGDRSVDLLTEYRINEDRFKNQSPRRVARTWTGWIEGAPFDGERPLLTPAGEGIAHRAAQVVGFLALIFALYLGARYLGRGKNGGQVAAYAIVMLLPLLMTRYVWPTHAVACLPALAILATSGGRRGVLMSFFVLTGCFYLAHLGVFEPLGQAGPLLLAILLLAGSRVDFSRDAGRQPGSLPAT